MGAAGPLSWPDTGPPITSGGAGELIYLMPCIVASSPDLQGAVPADRPAQVIKYRFTEGGQLVEYTATVDQDQLFGLLYVAGLLDRQVIT
jgi:hypothetical protein